MASKMKLSGKVDVNTFVDQAAGLAKALDAGTALVLNESGKSVTFYCYNGGDFIMAVPYSKPTIAQGYSGTIAAGGSVFKVFADNKGNAEFLVKPNKAYIYRGPGKIEEV
ncbi:MAG: hypothetical protein WBM71_04570 [Sedimenticolaceae bacterium]